MTTSTGALRYGSTAAREMSARIGGVVADTTALAALSTNVLVADQLWYARNGGWYYYSSTATSGGFAVTAGGRMLPVGSPSTGLFHARLSTAAALPANTHNGATRIANANGALGNIDGIAAVLGDVILDKDDADTNARGLWVITSLGDGGSPWAMARIPEFDSNAEVKSGAMVTISEGNTLAGSVYMLTTADPINVNTTALTFTLQTALGALNAAALTIADAGNLITAANVETALQEVCTRKLQTRTVTITHADLTTVANNTAETENVGAVLPAGARVVGVDVQLTTQFTGGGATAVVMDVGVAGAIESLIKDFDAFGSVAAGAYYSSGAGTATRPRGNYTGAQIIATFAPDAAHNLNDLTAGSVTITVDFYCPGAA